jgi:WD40 repeat protein
VGHDRVVNSCEFLRGDKLLATASRDQTVKLWKVHDGSAVHTLTAHNEEVNCTASSPTADVLLSGDDDGVVIAWDTATGSELHRLPRQRAYVTAAAFDTHGTLAATGCWDGSVHLYDPRAHWRLLHELQAHTVGQSMHGLRFGPAPGAPVLASTCGDGTAKLWDLRKLLEPVALHTLAAHTGPVFTASFSPDGTRLATASFDATVRLWRVADGALLHTIAAHSEGVRAAAFHPRDGSVLASCSVDKTVKLWQVADVEQAASRA